MLEAGYAANSPAIKFPAGLLKMPPRYDWSYPGEPDPTRANVADRFAGGRVEGGGSAINGMLWVRGHKNDYNHWESLGCSGWGADTVFPYFKRAENFEGGEDEYRGSDGPQAVSWVRLDHPMTRCFLAAAQEAGHLLNPDYNGRDLLGVSKSQVSQRGGLRVSTADAYLKRARKSGNVDVVLEAAAARITFEGAQATGVDYFVKGEPRHATASKEIIVSAGALASPKLLMLSGIGPAKVLRKHGIDVVADLPGVGENLHDHPHAAIVHEVTERTLNLDTDPFNAAVHGLNFIFRRRGALTSPYAHALLFGRLSEESPWADYEVHFAPYGLTSEGASDGDDMYDADVRAVKLAKEPVVACYPCLLHPKGRGAITLRSNDPGGHSCDLLSGDGER